MKNNNLANNLDNATKFLVRFVGIHILILVLNGQSETEFASQSRQLVRSTKPKSVYQTYHRRFEVEQDLRMSIGLIFSTNQSTELLYNNFRHLLLLVNEPMNDFVCFTDPEQLSEDHKYLLVRSRPHNFVISGHRRPIFVLQIHRSWR